MAAWESSYVFKERVRQSSYSKKVSIAVWISQSTPFYAAIKTSTTYFPPRDTILKHKTQ
jgi:hypothetical protein